MQQDKNDIEDKLRQLENQQLPDLSNMDNHWQAMRSQLNPQVRLTKTSINKNWLWMVAGVCIISFIILLAKLSGTKENKSSFVESKSIAPGVLIDTVHTIARAGKPVISIPGRKIQQIDSRLISKINSMGDSAALPDFIDTSFKSIDLKYKVENRSELSFEEKQIMLKRLLIQLQKKSEVFTINNNRDTVIKAREGSVIFIPSNSFNAMEPVVFEVREFYKYSDMLANGLTTLSGDRQLVTGGMIYLSAKVNGQEVLVNPAKEIQVFIPNISAADSMQIFEGEKTTTIDKTTTGFSDNGKINWKLTKVRIDSPVVKMFIRAIDLRDELSESDYRTTFNGKTKAVFHMSLQSLYSKDELKAMLRKKYGDYYDKIVVKKPWKRNLLFKKVEDNIDEEYGYVNNSLGNGDTAELLPSTVRIYKLTPIDTVYRIVRWVNIGYKDVKTLAFPAVTLSDIGEKYGIRINKLGWINCDRFYNYMGKKSDFIVDLKDSAFNYVTYLVFEKFKSIMTGVITGNYAMFPNVPVGEHVKIISLGVRDGKTVATVKSTIISESVLKELSFEPTSASALKSSLSTIDK